MRRDCGDIWTCWNNPLEFVTPPLTATAENVQQDSNWYDSDGVISFLSWNFSPVSASNVGWEVSWDYAPLDKPVSQTANYYLDADAWILRLNALSPGRPYDLWLKPGFPPGGQIYPYWAQEWQGPFSFTTSDYCNLITEEIFCAKKYRVGTLSSGGYTEHLDLPPTVCAPDASTSGWEKVFKFRSIATGPVNIAPIDVIGQSGRQCLVFYKKASQGCSVADGWENLGCWEMGTTPPTLTFQAEKDSLYYIAFDTREVNGSFVVDDFAFRIEACPDPCPRVTGLECVNTDSSTALIRWNSLGPNKQYALEYIGSITGNYITFEGLTDTAFMLTGLNPDEEYRLWIRYLCNGEQIFTEQDLRVKIGIDHPNLSRVRMSPCNPLYARPGGQTDRLYFYDWFDVEVPVAGEYVIAAKMNDCVLPTFIQYPMFVSIYENNFDPNTPLENLLNFTDSLALTETPTKISVNLQPGQSYRCVIARPEELNSPFANLFHFCADYEIGGPGFARVSKPCFQGREPSAHGNLPKTPALDTYAEYGCPDTLGWLHMYRRGPDDYRYDDDFLLFSIQDYPDKTSAFWAPALGGGGAALRVNNPPATYAINPSGWFVMDRYWDVQTEYLAQPTTPLLMRFYFTNEDFQALRDSVSVSGSTPPDVVEQLYFYKINDFFNKYNPDPRTGHIGIPIANAYDSDGYWEYKYGLEATDSTWRHEPFLDGHMSEMLIRHFSGGGGGIGGNLQGATVRVRPPVIRPNIRIYPNPTSNWLRVEGLDEEYPDGTWRLSDVAGHLHLSEKTILTQQLDISRLSPGVYFLTLETRGGIYTWQIVKL